MQEVIIKFYVCTCTRTLLILMLNNELGGGSWIGTMAGMVVLGPHKPYYAYDLVCVCVCNSNENLDVDDYDAVQTHSMECWVSR